MRMKLALGVLLLFPIVPGYAAGPEKDCPAFKPSDDPTKWKWMDGDCHIRTRAELDRILANHKVWLRKYKVYLGDWEALDAHGALSDPLYADLGNARLIGANFTGFDLTSASLMWADLTRANFAGADLTGANLFGADLIRANLSSADMRGAGFSTADMTGASLAYGDLTSAEIYLADMTGADLRKADLTSAELRYADMTGADFFRADLTSAILGDANLTGATLFMTDLTSAYLGGADLSGSFLGETDLSDTDLTFAKLWYADFEPMVLPPVNSIARTEGLETLRWQESFDEMDDRRSPTMTGKGASSRPRPSPSVPERWLVWLSRYREIRKGQSGGWRNELGFLWSDMSRGLQPRLPKAPSPRKDSGTPKPDGSATRWTPAPGQNQYALIDLRNELKRAGYTNAEMEVNLAYKRHTQSAVEMILYDWTCAYGAAPGRPLVIALVLALLAVPLYWLGFRHRLLGGQLLRVEKQDGKDVEMPLGNPLGRPRWRTPKRSDHRSLRAVLKEISKRKSAKSDPARFQVTEFLASCWPRVRWEAAFLKSVVVFSLMSVVNLGFQGLDFGRWVRNFFFREYDLKARGWLRAVSGLQSLVGLGLLALSLLSFFGHPFD